MGQNCYRNEHRLEGDTVHMRGPEKVSGSTRRHAKRRDATVLTLLQTLAEYEARGIVERLVDGRYSLTAHACDQHRMGGPFNLENRAEG